MNKKQFIIFLAVNFIGIFFGFAVGWKLHEVYMEKHTVVYHTIGSNKEINKTYKSSDGLNCIDAYELQASFCSAYPVKAVNTLK